MGEYTGLTKEQIATLDKNVGKLIERSETDLIMIALSELICVAQDVPRGTRLSLSVALKIKAGEVK